MNKLTATQKTLLKAIASFLAGKQYAPQEDVDFQALAKEAIDQAVCLPCLQGLNTAYIPQKLLTGWQRYSFRALKSNISIHEQHGHLHELMTGAGITYCVLKGSSSAYYYFEPLSVMRSMGDVDFLVAKADLERAAEVLIADGFDEVKKGHAHHDNYYKGKISYELHFDLPGIPVGEKVEPLIRSYFDDIFEKAQLVEVCGYSFLMPSAFHHGLISLMHIYNHLIRAGIGLRHLCDWAVFVKSFEGESFRETFEEKLSQIGLWKFAQVLSYIAHTYLGITYREWMGKPDKELCESLICDVFNAGNFGTKDGERSAQAASIADKDRKMNKPKLFLFLKTMNETSWRKYKRLEKIPIIKHFGFIAIGVRYLFRTVTGKRKAVNFAQNFKDAEDRRRIYKQLKFYEVE